MIPKLPCTADPEGWFPDERDEAAQRFAARLCRTCPIRQQCLDDCMRAEQGQPVSMRFGIYGGMTPAERAELAVNGHGKHTRYRNGCRCPDCRAAWAIYHTELRQARKEAAA